MLIILSSDRSASQTFVTDFNTVMCQSLCILVLKLDHKALCGLCQEFFIFKKIIKKQKVFVSKKHNVLNNTRPLSCSNSLHCTVEETKCSRVQSYVSSISVMYAQKIYWSLDFFCNFVITLGQFCSK